MASFSAREVARVEDFEMREFVQVAIKGAISPSVVVGLVSMVNNLLRDGDDDEEEEVGAVLLSWGISIYSKYMGILKWNGRGDVYLYFSLPQHLFFQVSRLSYFARMCVVKILDLIFVVVVAVSSVLV